jgi:hypothetical protein
MITEASVSKNVEAKLLFKVLALLYLPLTLSGTLCNFEKVVIIPDKKYIVIKVSL